MVVPLVLNHPGAMEFKLPDLSPTAAGAPAVWNRAENVRDWEKQALWYVHPVLPDYNNECEVLKAFFAFFAQTPESIRQTAREALGGNRDNVSAALGRH